MGEELGAGAAARFVCLSGPSFAREVAAGQPTAIVASSRDAGLARRVQAALSFQNLRVYTNEDVVGTEFGGGPKLDRLAAGMVGGLVRLEQRRRSYARVAELSAGRGRGGASRL